jgi:hypothetical protein
MKSIVMPMRFAGAAAVLLVPTAVAYAQSHDDADHAHGYYAPGTPIFEDFVLGPTSPGKWGPPAMGTGATVTWSIMPAGVSMGGEGYGNTVSMDSVMPGGYFAAIQAAFAAWSAVANITFQYVTPDNGAAFDAQNTSANIRIGAHPMDGGGGTLAHGYYPPSNGFSAAGDIHFDSGDTWKIGFGGGGFDVFQVAAHEIGHAIGLNHTAVSLSLMNPFYTEAFSGPQADDIAGARFIYGAPIEVPEASTWVAGFSLVVGGLGVWRTRRQS